MSRATANINRLSPSEFSPWLWPTECAHRKSATIQAPRCTTERNVEVFDGRGSRERVVRVIRNKSGRGWKSRSVGKGGKEKRWEERDPGDAAHSSGFNSAWKRFRDFRYIAADGGWKFSGKHWRAAFLYWNQLVKVSTQCLFPSTYFALINAISGRFLLTHRIFDNLTPYVTEISPRFFWQILKRIDKYKFLVSRLNFRNFSFTKFPNF